jgi:hypothetical protein
MRDHSQADALRCYQILVRLLAERDPRPSRICAERDR